MCHVAGRQSRLLAADCLARRGRRLAVALLGNAVAAFIARCCAAQHLGQSKPLRQSRVECRTPQGCLPRIVCLRREFPQHELLDQPCGHDLLAKLPSIGTCRRISAYPPIWPKIPAAPPHHRRCPEPYCRSVEGWKQVWASDVHLDSPGTEDQVGWIGEGHCPSHLPNASRLPKAS